MVLKSKPVFIITDLQRILCCLNKQRMIGDERMLPLFCDGTSGCGSALFIFAFIAWSTVFYIGHNLDWYDALAGVDIISFTN